MKNRSLSLLLALTPLLTALAQDGPPQNQPPQDNNSDRPRPEQRRPLERPGNGGPGNPGGPDGKERGSFQERLAAIMRNGQGFPGMVSVPEVTPIVVTTNGIAPRTLLEMHEDLRILGRVLERAIDRSDDRDLRERAVELPQLLRNRQSAEQLVYLDGYGALLYLPVKFPLAPTMNRSPEKKDAPENSEWEQARRDVRGDLASGGTGQDGGRPAPGFDPKRLEDLKRSLLDALKNAARLRHVQPADFITVVLVNQPSSSAGEGMGHRSTLILRAKKADIDSLAKGDLEPDAFRAKVETVQY